MIVILIGVVIVAIAPASAHFIQREFISVDRLIASYKHSRKWLTLNTLHEAESNAIFEQNLVQSLQLIKKTIPPDNCVYSVQTAFVMVNTQRNSYILPNRNVTDEEFDRLTSQCRYILAMNVRAENTEPLYPMQRQTMRSGYEMISMSSPVTGNKGPLLILAKRKQKMDSEGK